MRWSPILNAALATAYIAATSSFIHFISSFRANTPDTILDSMGALSLLVFSAAVMGFLFFYQPVVLLSENKKKDAISYFLKTLGSFGAITVFVLIAISVR